VHRVCCCNGCPTTCCDFWSCSPTAPINVTFQHNVELREECDNGQSLTTIEGQVTITATMTRTDNADCNLTRYVANQVTLNIQWTQRVYNFENNAVCDQPPHPCIPDYCDDCICDVPEKYLAYTRTWTYNQVLNGAGNVNLQPLAWYTPRVPRNAALTILCHAGQCDPECVHPVLIFTPAKTCEVPPGGCTDSNGDPYACIGMQETVTCGPVYTCLADPICTFNQVVPYCVKPFAIYGRGCLSATSFDDPYHDVLSLDKLSEFPLTYSAADPSTIDCNPLTVDYKLGDSITTFDAFPCLETDLSDPSGVRIVCTPTPVTCSERIRKTYQWTM
jgi:hypothetical protein